MRTMFVLACLMGAVPVQAQERCTFELVAPRPQATSTGPEDVVRAIKVVDQPGSPVAIAALDLSELVLHASRSQYAMEGTIYVEVVNISEVPITRVELGRAAGWQDGFSSGRTSFGGVLGPGERRKYGLSGRSGGATGVTGELTVAVGIDAAWIGDCRYEPAATPGSVLRALRGQ